VFLWPRTIGVCRRRFNSKQWDWLDDSLADQRYVMRRHAHRPKQAADSAALPMGARCARIESVESPTVVDIVAKSPLLL